MAGENTYENSETPLKQAAPTKRRLGVPVALASLALLLAASLVAVAILYFQKEKSLMDLEGALQEARSSLRRSGISYGSEEELEGLGFLKSISGAFAEIQARVEEANASRAAAQERLRDLQGLVSGGWTFFGGSAYFFLQEAKSWVDAEQSCQSRGAHLTSVTSREEMKHLLQQSGGQTFWIGLTDRHTEGAWTWADGTKYDPGASLWAPRQPDNWSGAPGNQEDCVHASSQWNDISCSYSYKAFCKKAIPRAEGRDRPFPRRTAPETHNNTTTATKRAKRR